MSELQQEPRNSENGKHRKKKLFFGATAVGLAISVFVHILCSMFLFDITIFEGKRTVELFQSFDVDSYGGEEEVEIPELMVEEELEMEVDDSEALEMAESAPDLSMETPDLIISSSPNLVPTMSTFAPIVSPALSNQTAAVSGGAKAKGDGGKGKGPKIRLGNIFGGVKGSAANVLTGSFYDLKQTSDRKESDVGKKFDEYEDRFPAYNKVMLDIVKRWRLDKLEDYYKAPDTIKTTQIAIPSVKAQIAPEIFKVERKVKPSGWALVYSGLITPPETGTYRFVGHADDVLFVAINGDVVFEGCWSFEFQQEFSKIHTAQFPHFNTDDQKISAGKWIKMNEGEIYPIEVIVGEIPGGWFSAWLMVEQKDKEYQKNSKGYPVLPLFQTANTEVPRYEVNKTGPEVLEDGLVFGAN